jgi:DNA-binding MarR family transcriptional regulator
VQLQLDRVSTSRGLRSLCEKGLIERRQDSEDGREVHVRSSETGRQLFDDMFPRISALNIDLLEGLDAEHHGIFLHCLRELELHSTALNARFAVSEKANRRSGGTRHRWSRQSRIT